MTYGKQPWRKNLYENQAYPDNYTDASFLEELKKNINVREVTFKEAFLGASLVTQQLCLVAFFCLNFFYIHNDWISPEIIFVSTGIMVSIGYVIYNILEAMNFITVGELKDLWKLVVYAMEKADKKRHSKALISFLILGYVLSPILKTLTESVSTDTIYAMTVFMMGIHLVFFDYGVKAVIVSSSLSLNASVFASLCLASRLSSPFETFVLLTCAVQYFLLSPLLLSKMSAHPLTLLLVMISLSLYGLASVDHVMTVLFISVVIFLNLICPYLFVRWHTYKDNIYGPWDEAVVQGFK